ncbi:hypothetical protein SGRA_0707 [Saprospira grandis str. Lewin]|uniref:Uncharacterized protein n=1 Tax=Saprospira grandis (strain Lewin) TaxID=984262 RepID=H6L1A5_SAPGL|nr:hypothetical protein SGRA_0707 [Saprospira grandis str. Lewin]
MVIFNIACDTNIAQVFISQAIFMHFKFLVTFWGCPGLWPGRAVSQLAGLLGPSFFFALLKKLGLAFGHCCPSLSQAAAPPLDAERPLLGAAGAFGPNQQ